MKVEREVLVKALETIKPAVAEKSVLEELTHVWFDGKCLTAYDDILGIQTPFAEEGLSGGLRGNLLMGLLGASGAKHVEITPSKNGEEALLKAARANAKLPLLSSERAVWSFPKLGKKVSPITPELLEGLRKVMVCVGEDTTIPEQIGVTFSLEEDGLSLFSTDTKSVSWAAIPTPKDYDKEHAIVPAPFCKQLLRLCGDGGALSFVGDGVAATSKNGVGIFARLVECESPLDFGGQISSVLPKGYMKQAVPIPPRLKLAIERALVILNGKASEPVDLFVKENVLNIHAKSDIGLLRDSIPFDSNHAEAKLKVDPELLKRALDLTDKMLVTETCVGMFGGKEYVYLASSIDRN